MPELLVAIQTKTHPGHYVRMDTPPLEVLPESGSGSGHVDCNATSISGSEIFVLETNSNGTVSFRSTFFDNCYLSMSEDVDNGGYFNCQLGKREQEEFKIVQVGQNNSGGYKGIVGIESAKHPRRWLRINSNGTVTSLHGGYPFVEIIVVGLNTT